LVHRARPDEEGATLKSRILVSLDDSSLSVKNEKNHSSLMTKHDIVVRISEETGLARIQVASVIQKTMTCIGEQLALGRKVELRKFGIFSVTVRKARVGRNPNVPNVDVMIPSRAVVRFKSGKDLRDLVVNLTAQKVKAAAEAQSAETRK
jgi:DNA-binding protein HU-beta/integration host factor subunit alpha